MSALRFEILIDPLLFIHSLIQIADPLLCLSSGPGTVPHPRERAMSVTARSRALGAVDGTDHQQLVRVQGHEDNESVTAKA